MNMLLASFNRTIVDDEGRVMPFAQVTVQLESDFSLPVLRADEDGNGNLGNPITADARGFVRFYVAGGKYRITATTGAASVEWENYLIGTIAQFDAENAPRLRSVAAITYFLRDDATGDTNRDGTLNTVDSAFLTGNGLSSYLSRLVDFGRFQPTLLMSPGVFRPFEFTHPWVGLSYPNAVGDPVRTITNVVSNGGLCRLTVPTTGQGGRRALKTGDKAIIHGVLGATGANTSPSAGAVTLTIIDANTADIQGSVFGGAYTSGGKMHCTIIEANGNSQSGINLQDFSVLAPQNIAFDSGGFTGFIGLRSGQYSILDPGANAYHRSSVDIILSPSSSLNESTTPFITGNSSAHLQCLQVSRAALFTSRYVAGGLTIDFVKQVYYNAIVTASTPITYTGPGARGGTSPLVGQQFIKHAGGRFTDGIVTASWPGTIDGTDDNIMPTAGGSTTDNAAVRWDGTTGASYTLQNSAFIIDDSGNVSSFGGQIKFPDTPNPSSNANTLDEYEEGDWVPTFTCATPGTLAVTYTLRSAEYTKIGRINNIFGQVLLATYTPGTAAGQVRVDGLPFAAGTTTGHSFVQSTAWNGVTKAGYTQITAFVLSGGSAVLMFAMGSGVALTSVNIADLSGAPLPNFAFGGPYRAT